MKRIIITLLITLPAIFADPCLATIPYDTIFNTSGEVIICRITKVDKERIYYVVQERYNVKTASIPRKAVSDFSIGGESYLVYENTFTVDGRQCRSQLFSSVIAWFSLATDGVQKQTITVDAEKGIVTGRFSIPFSGPKEKKSDWYLRTAGMINFDVSVCLKVRDCHFIFSNFNHMSQYGIPGESVSFGKITTAASYFDFYIDAPQEIKNKTWNEIKETIDIKTILLVQELKDILLPG